MVTVGWASKFFGDTNVSAIRVIRILRPLRTVNSMPGMRKLIQSLMNSLPTLFDVFVLFLFFLVMFGCIATQLFMGLLRNRCMMGEGGELEENEGGDDVFCQKDEDCSTGYTCHFSGNPDYGMSSFDSVPISVLNIFIIITLEGWSGMMYYIRRATGTYVYDAYFIMVVLFGAFFVLNLMVAVQSNFFGQALDEEKAR